MTVYSSDPSTLSKPRILCLHGGGVTAQIFHLQARRLATALSSNFRLVFADGPFDCDLHADLVPFYGNMCHGRARRWSAWLAEHEQHSDDTVAFEVEFSMMEAMRRDAGTGPWVGLLGFSQGAKIVASVLIENQLRRDEGEHISRGTDESEWSFGGVEWKFGVLLAGRAKPFALSGRGCDKRWFDAPGELPREGENTSQIPEKYRIRAPTLHVHGTRDPGLHLHRQLLRDYCDEGSGRLVEWDEGHRIAAKQADVDVLAGAIHEVAKTAKVL